MRFLEQIRIPALALLVVAALQASALAQLPPPVLREVLPLPEGAPVDPDPDPDPDPVPGTRTVKFNEDPNDLLNPERGTYRTGVTHIDEAGEDFAKHRAEFGSTIAYDRISLEAYKGVDALPSTLISRMRSNLGAARSDGVKLVFRFTYTDTGTDATKARMLAHINQLAPVFKDYGDVIAWVEAGFVGRWGEWHGSTVDVAWNSEPGKSNVKELSNALLSAVPSNRMVAFRYPKHIRAMYNGASVTSSNAFGTTNIARSAHHNDCFLYDNVDRGTYLSSNIDEDKDFIEKQSSYTFTSGEACGAPSGSASRSNCSVALAEAARFHWNAMNDGVNFSGARQVIDKWKSQGCWDTLKRRLGYRFVLVDATLPDDISRGDSFSLTFRVKNDGFARLINPRTVYATLSNGTTRRDIALKTNPRSWAPGATTTVKETVQVPADLPAGTYTLSLWLPDSASTLRSDSRYAIRFANAGTWSSGNGVNTLAQLPIRAQ